MISTFVHFFLHMCIQYNIRFLFIEIEVFYKSDSILLELYFDRIIQVSIFQINFHYLLCLVYPDPSSRYRLSELRHLNQNHSFNHLICSSVITIRIQLRSEVYYRIYCFYSN